MAYIITNGTGFICSVDDNGIKCTNNPCNAKFFDNIDICQTVMFRYSSNKTKGYYIYDIGNSTKVDTDNKRIRIHPLIRQYIYKKANGKCVLCGKNINYEDFTIDHIIPLSKGGKNDIENFQCTCEACNQFKKNILPEDFMQKISEIFLHQLSKNCASKLKQKIFNKTLKMIL